MDMSNIAAMYSDTYANSANQAASKLTAADYSKASDDELLAACKQFEAYFIEQVYKGMMKTIPQSEYSSSSMGTMMDYYKDQLVQSVAEETSEQSGLGIAQMLYEQMKRNYGLDTVEVE